MDEPRCQHYALAHLALRQVGLHDPLTYLGVLASERAEEFLQSLLDSVGDLCRERGDAGGGFGAGDLKVHRLRIGDHPTAMIEFPQPLAVTEVYFTALILLTPPGPTLPMRESVAARYFTLEHGFSFDETRRTVLCEWNQEGAHLNMGDGPKPTPAAFAAAIERQVAS